MAGGWKTTTMSMPMGSAGILGISSGEKLRGIEIDPRTIVLFAFIFIILVKLADIFLLPK